MQSRQKKKEAYQSDTCNQLKPHSANEKLQTKPNETERNQTEPSQMVSNETIDESLWSSRRTTTVITMICSTDYVVTGLVGRFYPARIKGGLNGNNYNANTIEIVKKKSILKQTKNTEQNKAEYIYF